MCAHRNVNTAPVGVSIVCIVANLIAHARVLGVFVDICCCEREFRSMNRICIKVSDRISEKWLQLSRTSIFPIPLSPTRSIQRVYSRAICADIIPCIGSMVGLFVNHGQRSVLFSVEVQAWVCFILSCKVNP